MLTLVSFYTLIKAFILHENSLFISIGFYYSTLLDDILSWYESDEKDKHSNQKFKDQSDKVCNWTIYTLASPVLVYPVFHNHEFIARD